MLQHVSKTESVTNVGFCDESLATSVSKTGPAQLGHLDIALQLSACSKSLHGISSALICTTDSTVLQPPITLLIHAHYHHRFAKLALQLWSAPQTNVRLGRCFVNAACHECRPFWMTSQWQALTNQIPPFHTRYFCNTYEKFHGTFHTCMNSYVYVFIRVLNQSRLKKIHVCKIPCMILHYDTHIKSYTYEKLHVWKVTRMKNYTYELLHILNIEFWLVHFYTPIDSFTELLTRVKIHTHYILYV